MPPHRASPSSAAVSPALGSAAAARRAPAPAVPVPVPTPPTDDALLPAIPSRVDRSHSDAWGGELRDGDDWLAGLRELDASVAVPGATANPALASAVHAHAGVNVDDVDVNVDDVNVDDVNVDVPLPEMGIDGLDGLDESEDDDDLDLAVALTSGSSTSSSSSASEISSAASCSGDSDYQPTSSSGAGVGSGSGSGSGSATNARKRARRARDASVSAMTPSAKKERRKARNRELAAQSRERHRVEFEQIKAENAHLRATIARLEAEKAQAWGLAPVPAPAPQTHPRGFAPAATRAGTSVFAVATVLGLAMLAASDADSGSGAAPGGLTASVLVAALDAFDRVNARAVAGDVVKMATVLVAVALWIGAVLVSWRGASATASDAAATCAPVKSFASRLASSVSSASPLSSQRRSVGSRAAR